MALFDKFKPLADARELLAQSGVDSIHVTMEKVVSATEAVVDGEPMILAGTNNYLGLTFNPDCIEAACRAARELGTGTTGSRVANGTYAGHVALEKELADFFNCRSVIVFSTGYVANLGMLSTLAGPGDVFVIDADCHASIYDGCRLSGADIIRFRHNDAENLDKRLRRLGDKAADALVIVEGIYSMLGDTAPLADIAAVTSKYGAYLVVDEAHSLGVLGGPNGRGVAEEAGVEDKVDFIIGTFSKSLGAIGGFLRQQSRRARPDPLRQPALYVHGLPVAFHYRFNAQSARDHPRPAPAAGAALGQRPAAVCQPVLQWLRVGSRAQPGHSSPVDPTGKRFCHLEGSVGQGGLRQPGAAAGHPGRQCAAALQRQRRAHLRPDRQDRRCLRRPAGIGVD